MHQRLSKNQSYSKSTKEISKKISIPLQKRAATLAKMWVLKIKRIKSLRFYRYDLSRTEEASWTATHLKHLSNRNTIKRPNKWHTSFEKEKKLRSLPVSPEPF
jgi:hypothetical protein